MRQPSPTFHMKPNGGFPSKEYALPNDTARSRSQNSRLEITHSQYGKLAAPARGGSPPRHSRSRTIPSPSVPYGIETTNDSRVKGSLSATIRARNL